MGKYIAIILLAVALCAGAFFFIFNKGATTNLPTPIQKLAKVTPATKTSGTSDQSIDADITAMEKDLKDLDAENADLVNEVNNL